MTDSLFVTPLPAKKRLPYYLGPPKEEFNIHNVEE